MSYIKTWNPPISRDTKDPDANLEDFKRYLRKKHNFVFQSYWDLHEWSVKNNVLFWEELWNYLGIITSKPYEKVFVKTGDGFLDAEWFVGAKMNFAENLLRYRDESTALIYVDELGCEETVTFAELYEKVKEYAAAFRKHGLKAGDTVASYMSNRTEAVYAMLAAVSVGAIFGGILPQYPAKSVIVITKLMEPKFLITVDSHQFNRKEFKLLDNLQEIVNNTPSLQKVIIVPTLTSTTSENIAYIRNGVLLEDFLAASRTATGEVPELEFEQLPSSHPTCISFTSGTTGVPKGFVHSASALVSMMRDYVIHWNLKKGDIAFNETPAGCSMWDYLVPLLGCGVGVLLYQGVVNSLFNGLNYWDIIGRYGVSFIITTPINVIWMEELNIVPHPGTNLDRLKTVLLTSSTIYNKHFNILQTRIKKDLFIGNMYGATETYGDQSGFDHNMPFHAPEVQVISLGIDVKCLNSKGIPVEGERGDLVLLTNYPALPTCLWKEGKHGRLSKLYLEKYPGFWYLNDIAFFNPKTKGFIVLGRCNNSLKQYIGADIVTEEIYFAIHHINAILDCICVVQTSKTGRNRLVLFVKLRKGYSWTQSLKDEISQTIERQLQPECVPEVLLQTKGIPYNLNHKKLERIVKQIIETNEVPVLMNIENPESLPYFCNIPELLKYNEQ